LYEYKVTRYDPETHGSELFPNYIDTILKLKAEARGYPTRFVARPNKSGIKNRSGRVSIQGKKDSIKKNATKRGLA
jgi:hypothetical protein